MSGTTEASLDEPADCKETWPEIEAWKGVEGWGKGNGKASKPVERV